MKQSSEQVLRANAYIMNQYWNKYDGGEYSDIIKDALVEFDERVGLQLIEDIARNTGYYSSKLYSMMCKEFYFNSKRKLIKRVAILMPVK